MIKRIIALLGLALAFSLSASAQSLTTITGTLRDQTGALITSGQVVFTLQPGIDTMTSGIARFSPTEVDCTINGSGLVKALDGVSACTLVQNTSIQPSGTSYRACLQPGFISPGSCFVFYALTSSLDITTTPATPPLTPAYSLVDTFSNQTIGGNKTFSGTVTFGGTLNLGAVNFSGAISAPGITDTGDFLFCATCTAKWGSSGTSSPDVGLSRLGAGILGVGNSGQGDATGTFRSKIFQVGGSDTGITRDAAGVVDIGNGTQGDTTGIVKVAAVKTANVDSVLWVDGIKYTTLAGCYSDIPSTGGVCKVPPGYAETLAADVLMTKSGGGFDFQGPAIITQGTKQFKISAGTSGAFIIGPMDQGGQACVTLPCTTYTNSTEFIYTGSSTAVVVGAATPQTQHAEIHGIYFNLTGAGNSAIAVDLINVAGHFNVSKNIVIGSGGASNAQVGFLTDGGGTNFTCDGELDENFVINTFIGFQTANMSCENVYKGNQIAMTVGVPANSICMDFEANNFGNVILGGNFSGCTTVLKVAGTGNANYFLLPINSETNDANFGASTSGNMTIYLGQSGAASNNPPVVTDTGTNNTFWSPNGLKIDSTGKIATYTAIATVGNGVPAEFGKIDRTGDNNNVGATTIYAVPANGAGSYRIHLYQIVTTVAGTSSTLPSVVFTWTDKNNSTGQTFTATSGAATGNSLTTVNFLSLIANIKASTNISFSTTGYASNPANAMQYATLITVEKL